MLRKANLSRPAQAGQQEYLLPANQERLLLLSLGQRFREERQQRRVASEYVDRVCAYSSWSYLLPSRGWRV